MGDTRKYRWQRRRERKARKASWHSHLNIFDYTALIFILALTLIYFRILVIYGFTMLPCAEAVIYFGTDPSYPTNKYALLSSRIQQITGALAAFWVCVTGARILQKRSSISLIIWHFIIFISLFFLTYGATMMAPSVLPPRPDGIMNITYKNIYGEYDMPSCIWLDQNILRDRSQANVGLNPSNDFHIDSILERQSYRILTDSERARFIAQEIRQKAPYTSRSP